MANKKKAAKNILIYPGRGFGLIELLIALLIVCSLVIILSRSMKKKLLDTKDGVAGISIRQFFRSELESASESSITDAGMDFFSFRSDEGEGSFSFTGDPPSGSIEKIFTDPSMDSHSFEIDNVSYLRFIYYDSKNRMIIDDDAFSSPQNIKRIKVILRRHSEENTKRLRESSFYIDLQ